MTGVERAEGTAGAETGFEPVLGSTHDGHVGITFETYRPLRRPEGRFRAETILRFSLSGESGTTGPVPSSDLLDAITSAAGRDRCVWGAHFDRRTGSLGWTFRMLARDPSGPDADSGASRLAGKLDGTLPMAGAAAELPAHDVLCITVDVEALREGRVGAITTLERIPDEGPGSWFRVSETVTDAHGVTSTSGVGHDRIFHPKAQSLELIASLRERESFDLRARPHLLGRVLMPELFACRRVVLQQRDSGDDAICFSGVNVEQLIFVFRRFEFPPAFVQYAEANHGSLDHLLFDVTVTIRRPDGPDAPLGYPRVSVHGSI